MTLARWEPFAEMQQLRNSVERLFEDSRGPRYWWEDGSSQFATNIYETEDAVVVQAALPGVKPEDVEVTVEQGHLTIRAKRAAPAPGAGARWLHRELGAAEYVRSILLPNGLKDEKSEAAFENGILTLTLPKAEEARPRQIRVRAAK